MKKLNYIFITLLITFTISVVNVTAEICPADFTCSNNSMITCDGGKTYNCYRVLCSSGTCPFTVSCPAGVKAACNNTTYCVLNVNTCPNDSQQPSSSSCSSFSYTADAGEDGIVTGYGVSSTTITCNSSSCF